MQTERKKTRVLFSGKINSVGTESYILQRKRRAEETKLNKKPQCEMEFFFSPSHLTKESNRNTRTVNAKRHTFSEKYELFMLASFVVSTSLFTLLQSFFTCIVSAHFIAFLLAANFSFHLAQGKKYRVSLNRNGKTFN